MKKTLAIYYSQSGQTQRALSEFLLARNIPTQQVDRLNLASSAEVKTKYRFPWTLFDFLRAQPEAFRAAMPLPEFGHLQMDAYDTVIIAYPVWFLSPATPVSAFLKSLPLGCLTGKRIITICTCRNMWVEAQLMVSRLIQNLGGEIAEHATLEDTAPSKVSLVNTLHFFLTGKKDFENKDKQDKYGTFGIKDEEYEGFTHWCATTAATPDKSASFFRFKESLVLAEVIGRRISRGIYLPWPLLRHLPIPVQNIYLAFAGILTFLLILLLMPPTVIIGNLPPFRQLLNRSLQHLINKATGFHAAKQVS